MTMSVRTFTPVIPVLIKRRSIRSTIGNNIKPYLALIIAAIKVMVPNRVAITVAFIFYFQLPSSIRGVLWKPSYRQDGQFLRGSQLP